MVATKQNRTRFGICCREGMDHILEYFATEHLSELGLALESFKEAEMKAQTQKEVIFVKRMRTLTRLLT